MIKVGSYENKLARLGRKWASKRGKIDALQLMSSLSLSLLLALEPHWLLLTLLDCLTRALLEQSRSAR